MPPHTDNVKTTPYVVPLIVAHTASVVTPDVATATALVMAAVAPVAVGPQPLQHWLSSTPHQLLPLPPLLLPPLSYNTGCHPETNAAVMFLHAMFLRTDMQQSSNSEPSSEEEEFEDYFEDEGKTKAKTNEH